MAKSNKQVVLGVAAHPDDLDFSASGTFTKWAREGADCYYLICTDGSKGSDDLEMTEERLVAMREAEQRAAGKIIGLKDVFFLRHKDTELAPTHELKKEIVRYIRKLKPNTVVTFDPTYIYSSARGSINHTDHRAAGQATMDAVFPLARDRLTFQELENESLAPHKVSTLYLVNFDNAKEVIDISDTFETKLSALKAHASQVDAAHLVMVEEWARSLGKKSGFQFGEGFVKLEIS